ncbi:TetR/AcrR family transcriptional regulator [Sutterella wadsworthensis]|mgnify:CR=1 FL=1|uniref:TetR/AcrR family transcriptional regulator n=1 Tax=Sutterella wadsworthensis TaxID=40545 RepID=UPI001F0EC477|nr:TetR/AcrR family transcriptional regulator [Sutterella wadsworthensis]
MSPVADQERTERLAEQHRREIVDAAERLVKGNGLHQLKLRDIAKESGKSLGNLYNYFQNKEAIIEALVEREKSRFLMVVSQKIEPLPGEDYKSMLRRHLEQMADAYLDPDSLLLAISVAGRHWLILAYTKLWWRLTAALLSMWWHLSIRIHPALWIMCRGNCLKRE